LSGSGVNNKKKTENKIEWKKDGIKKGFLQEKKWHGQQVVQKVIILKIM